MWSHHRSFDWHLCSYLLDYWKNNSTNVPSLLQSSHENHETWRCLSTKRWKDHSLSLPNIRSLSSKEQNLSTTPKSESVQHVSHSGHGSAAHTTPGHIETTSPHILEPQIASTLPGQSSLSRRLVHYFGWKFTWACFRTFKCHLLHK